MILLFVDDSGDSRSASHHRLAVLSSCSPNGKTENLACTSRLGDEMTAELRLRDDKLENGGEVEQHLCAVALLVRRSKDGVLCPTRPMLHGRLDADSWTKRLCFIA